MPNGALWVPIIRSWALTRGFALHPGTSCVASFIGSSRCGHNHRKLHTYLGGTPPAEFEAAYAARQPDQQTVGNQ